MANFFYNKNGIGDVLIVKIKNSGNTSEYKRIDDISVLYENEEVIGYNIFDFSNYEVLEECGYVHALKEDTLNKINEKLQSLGLPLISNEKEGGFKVGLVIECEDHPDSDHLHVCKVDIGSEVLQIVCGAANVEKGKKVVVATPGTMMMDGSLIIPSSLRGVPSNGMLCSKRELNLTKDTARVGLYLLGDEYSVGDVFDFKKEC